MADYRAINRNFKAVEQRKKLANTFSTPASKFTPAGRPGMVSTPTPVFGDTFAKVMLGPDKKYFGGVSGPLSEATGLEDLVNRQMRNMTVDAGDAVSRIKQDTFMGGKGKSGLQDYPLVDPNSFFGNALRSAGPMGTAMNYTAGNLINNADFHQAQGPGDALGPRRLVSGALTRGLRLAAPIVTSKVGKAAAATTAALGGFGAIDTDNAMAMNVNPTVLKTVLNKGGVQGLLNLLDDAVNDVPAAAKEASKLIGRQDKTGRVRSIFSDINRNYDKRVLAAQTGVANTGSAIQDLWSTTPKIFREALLKTHYATTGSVPLNQKDMYKATSKLLSDLQAKYGDDVVSIENALLNPEGGKWTWGHFGDVAKGAPHGLDFGGWQEATANFARRTFN